jgi:hypothetical protein
MKKKGIKYNPFSLVELFVAMVVLLIIMLCMFTLLSSTQGAFSASIDNDSIYSNTRVAFDLITRDLQSSLYEEDKIFFWQKSDSEINFIAVCESSKICEVRYKLDANNIKRSAIDSDTHNWNFYGDASTTAWNAGDFHDIMPYVTDLIFTCFDKNGAIIPFSSSLTPYPYSVKIDITTLGRRSFLQWQESGESTFKDNNTRTFSKTVYLGDRY